MRQIFFINEEGKVLAEFESRSNDVYDIAYEAGWLAWDEEAEEYLISSSAWEQGVRRVIWGAMEDDGKFETFVAITDHVETATDYTEYYINRVRSN